MNDRQPTSSAAPLAGVRVLDFTHVLAGPFCTRLLADLGADVVRVESSKHPDHPWPSAYIDKDGRHASYLNTNRNKRSIAIDLKNSSGQRTALDLAARADVVVENFSAGVMDRLGLGYETLRSRNQGIIYVSMSGYGHDGPRRDWTSMNMNLQGYSGLMTVTGADGDPPTAISNSWNDYIGGLHACFAIVQAVEEHCGSGHGTHLDLSQFECSVAMISPLLLASAVTGRNPPRLGNRSARFAPQGVYRSAGADEWCALSVRTYEQWRSLGRIIGKESWAAAERFATVIGRQQCHDEIDEQLSEWTSQSSNLAVEETLKAGGIRAERVRRINDLLDKPGGATVFRPMAEPRVGSMRTTGLPFQFSSGPLPSPSPAPALGQHSDEILRQWLALGTHEIASLKSQGALS
jgi:crotonobetainyl-CoA:carnitine CoA-transferase CaiB-like acyl-CoA transferase